MVSQYQTVPINRVWTRPSQVRQEFDEAFIDELAKSIKREGIIVPIIVREQKNGFEIIAGEQRWRAAKKAGVKQVPVAVVQADQRKVLELALVENLKRKDLQGWEKEDAIARMAESGLYKSLDELAGVLDVKKNQVQNILTSRKLRKQEDLPRDASTRLITATASTDPRTRRAIIDATEEGGGLPKDIPIVTKLVASVRPAPEKARVRLVKAVAKQEVPIEEVPEIAAIVEDEDEVEQLVRARRTLPEREYKSILSYVAKEKKSGKRPILKTVITGDINIWNTYLNTVKNAQAEIMSLSPTKCKGWDVEHRNRLKDALLTMDGHIHKMLGAIQG
jgi:ParB/RepB/Spo0J family partition protein